MKGREMHREARPSAESVDGDGAYAALMARVAAAHRAAVAHENADETRWQEMRRNVHAAATRHRRLGPFLWMLPIAAAALAVVLVVGNQGEHSLPQAFVGRVDGLELTPFAVPGPDGAMRVMALAGGHRLEVHPGGSVDIKVNDASHFLASVDSGTAFFEVVPRTGGQTFEVEVGAHRVIVRGTAFEVRRGGAGQPDAVRVLRGKVEVVAGAVGGVTVEAVAVGAGETWTSAATRPSSAAAEAPMPESPRVDIAAPENVGVATPPETPLVVEPAEPTEGVEPSESADPVEAGVQHSPVIEKAARSDARKPGPRRDKASPKALIEPLDAGVEAALLASLRSGDCNRADRALHAIIKAHGEATAPQVWWMKAWCARKSGDIATSRRLFAKVRGKVAWPVPVDDSLPSVP